jgi:cytochrome oxidase Cu insertion factor (SCO1/SenC/PrrC family)
MKITLAKVSCIASVGVALVALVSWTEVLTPGKKLSPASSNAGTLYGFNVRNSSKDMIDLRRFAGKVVLVVNVASE